MINLKLAQYYETGDFEKFLKLGEDFFYGGNGLRIYNAECNSWEGWVELDKKDPFNRFGGLFDGRTYGDGRFVLIQNNGDDVYCAVSKDTLETYTFLNSSDDYDDFEWFNCDNLGNIHENPDLWSKIK